MSPRELVAWLRPSTDAARGNPQDIFPPTRSNTYVFRRLVQDRDVSLRTSTVSLRAWFADTRVSTGRYSSRGRPRKRINFDDGLRVSAPF